MKITIDFLRNEVKNYQRSQGNKEHFLYMAKHHKSKVHRIRYNELEGIYCDTLAFHKGRMIGTLENLQYFPAKITFYYLS